MLQVGGHPSKTAQDVIEQIQSLDGEYKFETYFSLSCQNCPDVVQALNLKMCIRDRTAHCASPPPTPLHSHPWGSATPVYAPALCVVYASRCV